MTPTLSLETTGYTVLTHMLGPPPRQEPPWSAELLKKVAEVSEALLCLASENRGDRDPTEDNRAAPEEMGRVT